MRNEPDGAGIVAKSGFVGRERELALLKQAWKSTQNNETRIISIEGDPGIGKTALIRRFLREITPESLVWASGDEAETNLPWGVLSQIAQVLGTPGGPWEARADPVFVGPALARELQDCKDLVLVIDDAQWADRLSLATLRLAARRLLADPIMLIMIHQTPAALDRLVHDHPAPDLDDGWRRLFDSDRGLRIPLTGLPAPDLIRLAVDSGHPGLSPGGAARLHAHTDGHPLHARHLLAELPTHAISYGHGPLPAPRTLATAIRSRLARCAPDTYALVAAAAVLGNKSTLTALRDLTGNPSWDAIAEAVEMRLLEEVPGSAGLELGFPGAMVRGLVYHEVDRGRRRELHRRAAARGGAGALWHRIAAADGPDEELADDVEREARTQLAHGQIPLAATQWRHALELTPPGATRAPRLLGAVEALLVAGDIATSLEYQGEVAALGDAGRDGIVQESTGSGPESRNEIVGEAASGIGRWADYVVGYQLMLTGHVAEAAATLLRALGSAERHSREPVDLEARIASQLVIIGVLTVSYPEMVEHATTAVQKAREPWVAAFAWFAKSLALAVVGRGGEALDALAGVDAPGAPSGLDGLVARGIIRLWTDDPAGGRDDLAAAVNRAARGESLRVGQALGFLGEAEYRLGALGEAVLHAELAVGDAEDNGRMWDYAMLHAIACYPLAAQGAWERAEAHAEQASRWARLVGTPAAVVYAAMAQAVLAQARNDPAWLLVAAEEVANIYPTPEPGTHLFGPVRADALAQLGRIAEAEAALAAFQARLGTTRRGSIEMCAARVRAQIATASGRHHDALHECRIALQIAREIGLRLEAARIELLTGRCQHALGRRAAAERSFRSAMEHFTAIGANAYVTQTLDAAHAAGLTLDAPPAALGSLTPAERAVVTLATAGNSNREIAERLVLSVKTVEFHLTNVFRKLDIGTRDELRRVLPEPGWPPEIPGVRPGSPRPVRHLR
ncbi:LuxR family transcriptional regulator [Acrocarpospora corrugata]|uniref:LuxR family transcriptional regulator n=1 Tax=Acrocarpospora corrugata TaxID=35763 RepID=A0A5M3WB00_9ACTN|nr:AAA family ATPase [Acrocarpospora corrugata]GES05212.1 LuxR family transcriptional regulator [Acrocarpospora corrugata]